MVVLTHSYLSLLDKDLENGKSRMQVDLYTPSSQIHANNCDTRYFEDGDVGRRIYSPALRLLKFSRTAVSEHVVLADESSSLGNVAGFI